jgi:hypothetical protein
LAALDVARKENGVRVMKRFSYSLGKAGWIAWVIVVAAFCASLAAPVQGGMADDRILNQTQVQDPAGDARGADLSSLTVTTYADGTVSFSVRFANRDRLHQGETAQIFVDLNADGREDLNLSVWPDGTPSYLARWTGTDWANVRQLMEFVQASGSISVRLSLAELRSGAGVAIGSALGVGVRTGTVRDPATGKVDNDDSLPNNLSLIRHLIETPTPTPPPAQPGSITAAVSITAEELTGTFPGGTFTAAGPAKAAGLICPSGKTTSDYGPNQGNTSPVTFKLDKIFTCADRSGTFTLRLNVQLDPVNGHTTATWAVTGGTLAYTALQGQGSLKGIPNANRTLLTDFYTGTLTGQPTGKTVPTEPASSPLKAVIGAPSTSAETATAGKRFVVTFPVQRSDNGAPLITGMTGKVLDGGRAVPARLICDPSVAGNVIRHSEQFRNGKATLSFVVPTSANGKLLKVKVTIKVGTMSTTKIANFRVSAPVLPLKAVIGAPSASAETATAGKRFVVTFPVQRSDNGAPLTTGKMICDPSLAGKVIRHSEQFTNGKATLSFVVPTSANGKLLKVKVTIKVGTTSTTKIANFQVNAPVLRTPGTNHDPGWPSKVSYDLSTRYKYDSTTGKLTGAVTTIKVSPAVDPDGDTLSYSWTATRGSIVGHGLTATWNRAAVTGSIQGGNVVVTASDGHGGTATYTFEF